MLAERVPRHQCRWTNIVIVFAFLIVPLLNYPLLFLFLLFTLIVIILLPSFSTHLPSSFLNVLRCEFSFSPSAYLSISMYGYETWLLNGALSQLTTKHFSLNS